MDHHILLKLLISLTMLFTVYETFAGGELLEKINSEDATPALESMTSVKWITKSKPCSGKLLEMNEAKILENQRANANHARIRRNVLNHRDPTTLIRYPQTESEAKEHIEILESDINFAKTVNIKYDEKIKEYMGKTEELKKQIAEKKRLATLARDEIEILNNLINQTEHNATLLVEKEEEIASVIITKLQIENEELKRNQTVKPESVEDKNKILLLQTEKKIVEDKTKQLQMQMDELKNKSVKVASDSEFLNNRIMNLTVQVEYFNSARQKTENAIRNCELKAQTFFMEKNQIEGEASNMELHPGFHEKLKELKRVDWCCLVKKCGEIDKTRFLSSQMLQQYQGYTFRPVTQMETKPNMEVKLGFGLFRRDHYDIRPAKLPSFEIGRKPILGR